MRRATLWIAGSVVVAAPAVVNPGCVSGAAWTQPPALALSLLSHPWARGGYSETAEVSEIAARWDVPEITPPTQVGLSETVVSTRVEVSDAEIELGTLGVTTSGENPQYFVFWSDTSTGIHPRLLGRVDARDTVPDADDVRWAGLDA